MIKKIAFASSMEEDLCLSLFDELSRLSANAKILIRQSFYILLFK